MSNRNLGSLDKSLASVLNDIYTKLEQLARRRPSGGGGGGGDCDCQDGAPGLPGSTGPPGAPGAPGQGVPTGGSTGQALTKNSNTDFDTEWSTVSGGGPTALDDLTDVSTFGASAGDALKFDGADWVPGELTLDDLGDVDTTGVSDGDSIFYDNGSSTWLPGAAASSDIPDAGSALPAAGNLGRQRMFHGVLFVDNGVYWWPTGGLMEQIQWEWTNFLNNNSQKMELQSAVSGTGATSSIIASGAGQQGIVQLGTGTDTTGRSNYSTGVNNAVAGGTDKFMQFHTRVRFPTLSTSGERYYFTAGWFSNLTAAPNDGYYFRYDESVSPNFFAVVVNNSTGAAGVDTGVAVATNSFQKLRIDVDEVNASVKFYVAGTLTNTITTNLPASTRNYGLGVNIRKSVGNTSRSCDMDYIGYWTLMTTTV